MSNETERTPLLKQKAMAKACNKNFFIYSLLLIDTKNLLLLFTEKHSELSIECAPRFLQAKIVKQLGIGEIPTFK